MILLDYLVAVAELSSIAQLLQFVDQLGIFLSQTPPLIVFDGADVVVSPIVDCVASVVGVAVVEIGPGSPALVEIVALRAIRTAVATFGQLIIVSLVPLKDVTFDVIGFDNAPVFLHALGAVAHLT